MIKKIILSTQFLAILCCILWATPFVGIKIGLEYTTPLQFAGIRFFLAGLLILPFIKDIKYRFRASFKYWKVMLNIALLQTTLLYSFFYIGLNMVPGSVGAMIVGSGPIFVAITANFMMKDDKMDLNKMIAILIGIIGVIVVSIAGKNTDSDSSQNTAVFTGSVSLGITILIIKNFLGSVGNVIIAQKAGHIYPRVLAAFSLSFGGALIIVFSQILEHPVWTLDLPFRFYFTWIWLAMVSSIAIAIWYTLLQRPGVKVSELNFWTFLIPIFGVVFSWIILPGEHFNWPSVLGIFIICMSLVMINYSNRKKNNPTINKVNCPKNM